MDKLNQVASIGNVSVKAQNPYDSPLLQGEIGRALFKATANGELRTLRNLLDDGANINVVDRLDLSLVHFAVNFQQEAVLHLLIERDADLAHPDVDGNTPLHCAAKLGLEPYCRILLDAGASISAISKEQRTPLHYAASAGYDHICRLFIKHRANIEALDNHQRSPLGDAARHGQGDACRVLLDAGAKLDEKNLHNVTPLQEAVDCGHAEVCRLLIERGADPFALIATYSMPFTTLHLAVDRQHVDVCKVLVEAGVSPSYFPPVYPDFYHTPFQSAVSAARIEAVRFFVHECDEDIAQRTFGGQTMVALAQRSPEMMALLRSIKTELAVQDALHDAPDAVSRPRSRTDASSAPSKPSEVGLL